MIDANIAMQYVQAAQLWIPFFVRNMGNITPLEGNHLRTFKGRIDKENETCRIGTHDL